MTDLKVTLNDTELRKVLQNQLAIQMAKALKGDAEKIIRAIIDESLNKKTDTYSRETVFTRMLTNAIQEEAKLAVGQWLTKNRPTIRKQIAAAIKETPVAERLVNALADGVSNGFYVDFRAILKENEH